jgi:hypothetical protein
MFLYLYMYICLFVRSYCRALFYALFETMNGKLIHSCRISVQRVYCLFRMYDNTHIGVIVNVWRYSYRCDCCECMTIFISMWLLMYDDIHIHVIVANVWRYSYRCDCCEYMTVLMDANVSNVWRYSSRCDCFEYMAIDVIVSNVWRYSHRFGEISC